VDRPRILVAGSINVDLVAHVERLPAPGETVAGGRLDQQPGTVVGEGAANVGGGPGRVAQLPRP
jgi:sugar/nucleoside kinase (ribokinase family)